MMKLRNFVTPLHEKTNRNYLYRMNDEKVPCMKTAKEYGYDYWDGDRRYGYGGYRYLEGYWVPVAKLLIETYSLTEKSLVLDVGCGKGYLLYELTRLLPGLRVSGLDISRYGIDHAKEEIQENLMLHRADSKLPFDDDQFDLSISLGCLHNLNLPRVEIALREIERVGKQSYICVESYTTEQEQFNVQCWALTAETLIDVDSWKWLFSCCDYTGDYEFIYFRG